MDSRQMADGRWQWAGGSGQVAVGSGQVADGRWQVAVGRWQMVGGTTQRSTVNGLLYRGLFTSLSRQPPRRSRATPP